MYFLYKYQFIGGNSTISKNVMEAEACFGDPSLAVFECVHHVSLA